VELLDYRELSGRYDAIVSIEMLEAVGAEYFATFFETCDRVLEAGGRMSLQTIAMPDADYEEQRRGSNWVQKYIFPGGLIPSLAAIDRALARTGLLISTVRDIAPHYARTLREWRTRFLGNAAAVRELGFDERFIRMWEFYLAQSEAGFSTGALQDLQIVLEKRRGALAVLGMPAS
jgi:cyclopropane-fatty-acyl-phospholipid synthase